MKLMPAPQRQAGLLSRIQRRFPTVTNPVQFGRIGFAFTRVADPNRVLDEVAAEEDRRERSGALRTEEPLHLPYWAELWDSGGGVAQHLVDQFPDGLTGKKVLDLGCGQGLAGCVTAALGADVLFADLESPALLFARCNAEKISPRIRTRQLNWQKDHLHETFDLIVGADILYERGQWIFLEPFWREHLAANGTVMLGEPGRPTGDSFIDWIQTRGWKITIAEQPVTTRPKPVRILSCQIAEKQES
jgi:predicted nicotinamide N-methyase